MEHALHKGAPKARPSSVVAQPTEMDCDLIATTLAKQCHLNVLARVLNSTEVLPTVLAHQPDLVFMSARLQDGPFAGLDAARSLHNAGSPSKIIMLLETSDRDLVVESFRHGARGVFALNGSANHLARCVSCVLGGEIWADSTQLGYVMEAFARTSGLMHKPPQALRSLTKREDEVLRLIAAGLTNKEIGEQLKLNQNTVKNYVSDIFQKLGLSTRVEVVLHFFSKQQQHPMRFNTEDETTKKFGT